MHGFPDLDANLGSDGGDLLRAAQIDQEQLLQGHTGTLGKAFQFRYEARIPQRVQRFEAPVQGLTVRAGVISQQRAVQGLVVIQ